MMDDSVEGREGAVVHVRRAELDVPQRRDAEAEARRLWTTEAEVLAEVERCVGSDAGPELRHAGAGEALAAEQRSEVARRAARLREEEECTLLRLVRDRVVVAREVTVEGRVGEREGGPLEGGNGVRRVLEA